MTAIRLLAAAGLIALPLALPASAQTAPAVDAPVAAPLPPATPAATMAPAPEEMATTPGKKLLKPAASPINKSHRCSSQVIS